MLSKLIAGAKQLADNRSISVPERMVNAVLPHVHSDVEEVRDLRITIREGHFDVEVHLNKQVLLMDVNADATVRFIVDSALISSDEQWVILRQEDKLTLRGHDAVDKIAAAVIEAIVFSLFDIDPVEAASRRLPNVRKDGSRYHVDLKTMLPADWENHLQSPWMRVAHVHAICCSPNRFELKLAFGAGKQPAEV